MTTLSDRLDKAMRDAGITNQMDLSKKTGISQPTISRMLKGSMKRSPSVDVLGKLAFACGVNLNWLISGKGEQNSIVNLGSAEWAASNVLPEYARKVPVISWVQAGMWTEIADNFMESDASEWVYCPFHHSDKTYVLKIVGDSMCNPQGKKSYCDGEFIAVDPEKQPVHGSMVVVRMEDDNTATFKQLLIEANGNKILKALNPSWPEPFIKVNGNAIFCGIVIGKWVPE